MGQDLAAEELLAAGFRVQGRGRLLMGQHLAAEELLAVGPQLLLDLHQLLQLLPGPDPLAVPGIAPFDLQQLPFLVLRQIMFLVLFLVAFQHRQRSMTNLFIVLASFLAHSGPLPPTQSCLDREGNSGS